MLSPINNARSETILPYGSDMYPPWYGTPPSYPDFRPYVPHPFLPAGINDAAFACDEVDGAGINWDREVWGWDDIALARPTAMAPTSNPDTGLPGETGQTVDVWVAREKRFITVARDFSRLRARGFRGVVDE